MSIRVLIADDHELFLTGLKRLLDSVPECEVVGEAKDGRQAFRKAQELQPDLVIMDLAMPKLNGIEATRQLTAELENVKVLCLSMHLESRFVEASLEAGASGYLPKDSQLEELVRAIRVIMAGQIYLSPEVTGIVVDALKGHRPLAASSAFTVLTEREREVLQLLAEGRSTREIAAHLNMSPKTVHTHREHVMGKLHIHNIAGLTKYAIQEGLTSSEPRQDP